MDFFCSGDILISTIPKKQLIIMGNWDVGSITTIFVNTIQQGLKTFFQYLRVKTMH